MSADLATLFQTDPLELTREDVTAMVNALRQQRAQFELGAKTTKLPKTKAKEKVESIDLDALLAGEDIDIDDLLPEAKP